MANKSTSQRLPMLPLRGVLVFPSMVLHLDVGREKSITALERAMVAEHLILLSSQSEVQIENPTANDIYKIGTVAKIRQMLKLPNGTIRVLVEGIERAQIVDFVQTETVFEVDVIPYEESGEHDAETSALMRTVLTQFELYLTMSKKVAPEVLASVSDIHVPGRLADVITSHLNLKIREKQEILEIANVRERLERLLAFLNNEREVLEIEKQISQRVKKQMEKTQREYYLREQMKAIQKELGDKEGRTGEIEELRLQLSNTGMPDQVREKVNKEIDRLDKVPSASPEISLIRHYIEWLLALPWEKQTADVIDLARAEQILNEDHFGLDKAKERVLEYLAVQKLVQKLNGPILCLVGPPGVGKTSLARSVAKSLGRQFVRLSLGGVRDEAEIRGHRRTYLGALPGRIIQGLKNAGSNNPVILLDEIDKMAMDFRGDPAAALLEVLDPEQNKTFSDHFIELPFDLSNVMFITTANSTHTIPRPLLDRMEVLPIQGYTELEKLQIAKRHLLPKQLRDHGVKPELLQLDTDILLNVVRAYTRESGVRLLEQQLATICRKTAKQIVLQQSKMENDTNDQVNIPVLNVDKNKLVEFLGPAKYRQSRIEANDLIGAVTGLAWTEVGGDTMMIEVTVVPGKGKLTLTGKLGDVMKESAQAAFSYIRSKADQFGIPADFHETNDIHIHVPEGAIPKDGPSAGITMATAIISALTKKPVSREVAMTGEITLRGRVLPIGGLKEKSLAAHRAGIKKVLLPVDNEKDLADIPESVKEEMSFHFVSHMDEVLEHALVNQGWIQ